MRAKATTSKQASIDLGALHKEFRDATRALTAAANKHDNTREAFDNARKRFDTARTRLAEASRTVLDGE